MFEVILALIELVFRLISGGAFLVILVGSMVFFWLIKMSPFTLIKLLFQLGILYLVLNIAVAIMPLWLQNVSGILIILGYVLAYRHK